MKRVKQPSPANRSITWLKQPGNALYVAALGAMMAAYVALHYGAAYTLPFPWLDEAHFMWQANGFAEHLSLFAPELNSDRTIFWMPPGYFIILGAVIKLFGLSLDVARASSLILMLSAIVAIGVIIRRYRLPLLSLLLAAPFVLGAPFVAAGNIVRMEALLVPMLLLAFLFLQHGKLIVGLCLLALTPLVHPNGLYFLASGAIASMLVLPRPWPWRRPTVGETVLPAIVFLCWAGYAVYALLHWPDFVADMKFQFERKAVRNIEDAVLTAGSISLLVVVLLGTAYCYRKRLSVIFLLAIAVPAWWVAAAGIEMWYRVFFALSYYFLAVIFLIIAYEIAHRTASQWNRIVYPALVGLVACAVIGWNVMTSSFGEPLIFPDAKPWYKMTSGGDPYITDSDINKLRGVIDQLSLQRVNPVVEFYPAGDAFFFTRPSRPRIQFSYPLFCTRQADWYLVHVSERFTPAFNRYALELLDNLQVKLEELPQYFIHSRGASEEWFLVPGVNNHEFRHR